MERNPGVFPGSCLFCGNRGIDSNGAKSNAKACWTWNDQALGTQMTPHDSFASSGPFRGVKTDEGGHRWVTTRDIPQGSFGSARPNALALPTAEVYSQEILASYLSSL